MSSFELGLEGVVDNYRESAQTRIVNSVLPEVTDIDVPTELLVGVAASFGYDRPFVVRGVVRDAPRNLVEGIGFLCSSGAVDIDYTKRLNNDETRAVEDLSGAVSKIDEHFRGWSGIDPSLPTRPLVSLFAGKFSGNNFTDTNQHFDFKMAFPSVSYKDCFMGKPEHSSVYYPGRYKTPSKLTIFSRVMAGIPDPTYPKTLFERGDQQEHIMPAGVVWIEPWNAYHSGPTDPSARGTHRGILGVSYRLDTLLRTPAQAAA